MKAKNETPLYYSTTIYVYAIKNGCRFGFSTTVFTKRPLTKKINKKVKEWVIEEYGVEGAYDFDKSNCRSWPITSSMIKRCPNVFGCNANKIID